jgi:hypothetical protein
MNGTKVEAGLNVSMGDMPILKYKGFHACIRPLDALHYFSQHPNPNNLVIVSRVRLSGVTIADSYPIRVPKIVIERGEMDDADIVRTTPTNIVAQKREHLWIADVKQTVEAFGGWCYRESLQFLRDKSYTIVPIFDDAIKARLENSTELPTLANLALSEATASTELKRLLERLAASLTMNVIGFTLANAHTLAYAASHREIKTQEEAEGFGREMEYAYYKTKRATHTKLHDMLMQLAPKDYSE